MGKPRGKPAAPQGVLARLTLSDEEHHAFRKHLGQGARWPLPIRVALALAIAAGLAWALAIVSTLSWQVVGAAVLVAGILLVGTQLYGGRRPKALPKCHVVMTSGGYESAGARGSWADFGGLSEASVVSHPGGVRVVRLVGTLGWAELPLAAAARADAEHACERLLVAFPAPSQPAT
jgi:hypothetical protein